MHRPLATRLALLALAAPAAHAGSTWYVDVGGTPPGSGTTADPYTSLQGAIDTPTTTAGDTLLVLPGTYVENVAFHGKGLLIESTAGPLATVIQAAGPGPVVLGDTDGAISCVVKGFTITGAQGSAPGLHVLVEAFLQVERCIVRDNGGPGFLVEYDGWILSSTFVGNERAVECLSPGLVLMRISVAWGNTLPSSIAPGFVHHFEFNDLQSLADLGGATCFDCISEDPRFWDLAGRDLHLRSESPCIDAGPNVPSDPDGSPLDLGVFAYDPSWAPGTATFCDGTVALCPCGNGGAPGAGCDLPQATGGVAISIRDFKPDGGGGGTAEIVGSGYPPAAQPGVTLIRSTQPAAPPVVFGDGLRCIATSGLVRIGAVLASSGSSVHALNHGAGPGVFYYQLWTRSTPSTFCDASAAFNLSNALEIAWP